MERLLEFSKGMEEIFYEAIKTGDLETVLMFLIVGIDPNIQYYGQTPLRRAIIYRQTTIVKLLLGAGAYPNGIQSNSHTPLFYLDSDDPEIVTSLLEAGGDPNVLSMHGRNPLYYYVYWNYVKAAEILLLAKVDPNDKLINDKSLLHFAEWYGNKEMARLLKRYGAK